MMDPVFVFTSKSGKRYSMEELFEVVLRGEHFDDAPRICPSCGDTMLRGYTVKILDRTARARREAEAALAKAPTWPMVEALQVQLKQAEAALEGALTTDDVDERVLAAWDDFWRDIVRPDGHLDVAQIACELSDYYVALHEVALVYCDLTGSRFSKANTRSDYVIEAAREYLGHDAGGEG